MRWFRKSRKNAGWMAISFAPDGILAAHVVRTPTGKPSVESMSFAAAPAASRAAALEKFGKELQASGFDCTTLLGPGEYQVMSVEAPNVPPDELKVAVRWKLKDLLDYRVDDATVDVLDVPVDKSAAVRTHLMYAIAARNQVIAQRQTLFADAKIPLSVIDIPEIGQRNFSVLLESAGRGVAMLSFDEEGGLLTVTYGGELYLARRIELPLAQIVQADDEQRAGYFDRITLELQRSLDHFDRQYHFVTVARIVLAPLAAIGTALQAYLAEHLYLPVETLDLASVLDVAKVPQLLRIEEQQRCFLTLGIALRHEETVL